MVWGGLPLVVSAGDDMSRVVETEGLGRVVAPGDPAALAAAVTALLTAPDERRAASARARALACGALAWDRRVEPLARYCEAVAAGTVATTPQHPLAPAIAALNDGRGVELADAFQHLAWRAGNAWRLARSAGIGALWKRVWS
jgi:hypothetical protein